MGAFCFNSLMPAAAGCAGQGHKKIGREKNDRLFCLMLQRDRHRMQIQPIERRDEEEGERSGENDEESRSNPHSAS